MASAEEVIYKLLSKDYIHDDVHFVIDSNLRIISIPSTGVIAGVVGDKNVNRATFQMNRYYHGFDMSVFTARVNYINANNMMNFYTVTDMTIEDDYIYFSWLIDSDAVAYAGDITFAVNMLITKGDGNITQSFNTSNTGTLKVLDGIQIKDYVTPDEIKDVVAHIQDKGNEECEKIRKKGYEMIAALKREIYFTDENTGKTYIGELKIINGKPALKYEESSG